MRMRKDVPILKKICILNLKNLVQKYWLNQREDEELMGLFKSRQPEMKNKKKKLWSLRSFLDDQRWCDSMSNRGWEVEKIYNIIAAKRKLDQNRIGVKEREKRDKHHKGFDCYGKRKERCVKQVLQVSLFTYNR